MDAAESLALIPYKEAVRIWTFTNLRGLFAGITSGLTFSQFTTSPKIFYVRSDPGRESTVVNVFDVRGNLVYTIERLSVFSTLWVIYRAPSRAQVCKIRAGLFNREVFFIGKPHLGYRRLGRPRRLYMGIPDRKFYLNDGAPLEWTHRSKFLERTVNPGGGYAETRERLARVRLLRPKKFDWELDVDSSVDQEVALATSFISMRTQWTLNDPIDVRQYPAAPAEAHATN